MRPTIHQHMSGLAAIKSRARENQRWASVRDRLDAGLTPAAIADEDATTQGSIKALIYKRTGSKIYQPCG